MLVFVCSPYGGKAENVTRAQNYCAMEMAMGNTPVAPHVMYSFMDENTDRRKGMRHAINILKCCSEIHVWGKVITGGMIREIRYAHFHEIKVVYME